MGKIIPLLFLVIGVGGGLAGGLALAPEPVECPEPGTTPPDGLPAGCEVAETQDEPAGDEDETTSEFVRMNDQFVIPVLEDGDVRSLVVMSITLEVDPGSTAPVFEREPKLRDTLLRVLFDHANTGGFNGAYTAAGPMERLRKALLEAARKTAGDQVRDILILDLLRQEV
jgi:flagellar FliL protein